MKKILLTSALCIFAMLLATPTVVIANTDVGDSKAFELNKDPLAEALRENQHRIIVETHDKNQEQIETIEDNKIEIELKEKEKERNQFWAEKDAQKKKVLAQEQATKQNKVVESKPKVSQNNNNSGSSFNLSFYSTLPEENGGYSKMANGQSIYGASNVVASNYYAIGTKIYLEGWGVMTVSDRGGSAFNNSSRLDVLIQQKSGESTSQYKQRISNLGRRTVSGYVVK